MKLKEGVISHYLSIRKVIKWDYTGPIKFHNTDIVGYFYAKPSYPLSLFVKQYWAIENCLPAGQEHIQRIIPNGLTELFFYLGDKPKSLHRGKGIQEITILSGLQKEFYDITVTGNLSLFSISFWPHGARMFFNIPSNEVFDLNVPLKDIIKHSIYQLEQSLFESITFEAKTRIVERFLTSQLSYNVKIRELQRLGKTLGLISYTRGMIAVESLASMSCLCRKQYERIFLENIGTSPKQFLKIIRFQNSLHTKQINKEMSMTQLAYACGYYDQAHMINDYKALTGITPGQYFNQCEPFSDYFT